MKKRFFAGTVAALLAAWMASACDDGGGYVVVRGGGDDSYGCHHYATCGTCTPIDGCGWCQTGPGQGMCASDPDECSNATAFSWTWDPSGCVGGAAEDAGPVVVDSGTTTTGTTGLEDAATTPTDAAALH